MIYYFFFALTTFYVDSFEYDIWVGSSERTSDETQISFKLGLNWSSLWILSTTVPNVKRAQEISSAADLRYNYRIVVMVDYKY